MFIRLAVGLILFYFARFIPLWTENLFFKSGPDPVRKISRVKLRYSGLEHSDWVEIFDQPIRKLKSYLA